MSSIKGDVEKKLCLGRRVRGFLEIQPTVFGALLEEFSPWSILAGFLCADVRPSSLNGLLLLSESQRAFLDCKAEGQSQLDAASNQVRPRRRCRGPKATVQNLLTTSQGCRQCGPSASAWEPARQFPIRQSLS